MNTDHTLIDRPRATELQHTTHPTLARALGLHAVWFADPSASVDAASIALPAALQGRVTRHRHGALSGFTVDALAAADLPLLHTALGLRHACLQDAGAISAGFPDGDADRHLAQAGFKIFTRHGAQAASGGRRTRSARIGSDEFLLSGPQRLAEYPSLGQAPLRGESLQPRGRHRAVVVLDLVQDFEVLRPLLVLLAAPTSPFTLRVTVSERVRKAPLWAGLLSFLEIHAIEWFTPVGPADVAQALGERKSLLLTASESSATAHTFAHAACRIAPPRALRVTLQHGLECIGLRHHRAHDIDFPDGVRFASDLVLTWDHPHQLPDLHPAERHKCVAVGVVKSIAERAAQTAEDRWQGAAPAPTRSPGAARQLLVAENLHSVRFRAPARHQRFLSFIQTAQRTEGVELTIRSHPASRTLEKQRASNQLKFLDETLSLDSLLPFHACVSPPSTILLDTVLAGLPSAVWSDAASAGDTANYTGLPGVTDFDDWLRLGVAAGPADNRQLAWAVGRTAALNGVPAAWNTLVRLFD
jgi:hypothetical protein